MKRYPIFGMTTLIQPPFTHIAIIISAQICLLYSQLNEIMICQSATERLAYEIENTSG